MSSAICTLFEGDFHYGVGALVNSLYASGFRGTVWAGYRGSLPPWARPLREENGHPVFDLAEGCRIHFVPVTTERHLTNHKPDFMLELWRNHCPDAGALFYLDPDIIVKCRWQFFEEWITCGVALCEDVNSPVHSTHPLRISWQRFFQPHGFRVTRPMDVYLNGGFIGVSRAEAQFLDLWRQLMELMAPEVGGLHLWGVRDRTFLFNKTDQDGLNIAAMFSESAVSIVGQDAMDFAPGGYIMSHALGPGKPWRKSFILGALKGLPPTRADKAFWNHTQYPIRLYPTRQTGRKKFELRLAAAIGRIVSRS